MLTIRDIAKYCNVSTATVSKAFSSDSDISYETTERVRAAARALGYYPSAAARSLKTRHACNLGLLAQLNQDLWYKSSEDYAKWARETYAKETRLLGKLGLLAK